MNETLRFGVEGPRGAARTVLLSSGLGGLASYWQPQRAALAERYRVIAYDQRGTGRNPDTLPDDYSIDLMADDVIGILDAAGCSACDFVGHALGGLVGLSLALRYPARLSSLVVVNGWAKLDPHTERCFDVRTALLRDSGPAAYVRAQPIFLHPAAWLSRHADRLAQEEAHAIAHFQGEATLLRRIGALRRFDIDAKLGSIATRTLVVATRDDILVPYTCSEQLAAALPAATLAMFDTGGHAINVTDPEPFNAALLRFLDG